MLPFSGRAFANTSTAQIPSAMIPDLIALIDSERTATLNRLVTATLSGDTERANELALLADTLTGQRATRKGFVGSATHPTK